MSINVDDARRAAARLSRSAFRLVLASQSPRRRALLAESGYRFAALAPREGAEEATDVHNLSPSEYVRALADVKALDVATRLCGKVSQARWDVAPCFDEASPYLVLACDSVAVCNGEILGKPNGRADAERMLRALSGSRHSVETGMTLRRVDLEDYATGPDARKIIRRVETSVLQMEKLSEEQLRSYLDGGLWEGKAGAFGYQDGNDWLELISGSASNVVGLPLEALAETILELFPERA